jgi:hypothetical protein
MIAFVLLTSSLFSQTFNHSSYSSPNTPVDLFVADLNHDGKPDIVTPQRSAGMVTVFLNHGDGTFTPGGSSTYVVGASPILVTVADFNGDGKPDIATGNCAMDTGTYSVSVLFGNGDGTFQNHVDYSLNACPNSLGFMHVGHDSAISLIVSDSGSNLTILRNNGGGTFTTQIVNGPAGSRLEGASAGDYNRDGIDDIAAIMGLSQVVIFNGNTSGGFSAPRTVYSLGATLIAANTVDFNGDGIGDLLVPYAGLVGSPDSTVGVVALANNGTGSFSAVRLPADPIYHGGAKKAAEADLNNDGLHEIILPVILDQPNAEDAIAVFPGTSRNSWGAPTYIPIGALSLPDAVAWGNFNGDNLIDFAGVTQNDNFLHVFTSAGAVTSCRIPSAAGVSVCSPAAGTGVLSPVSIAASANGGALKITAMKAYLDGRQVAFTSVNTLTVSTPAAKGSHTLTVNAWNSGGQLFQTVVKFNVQ